MPAQGHPRATYHCAIERGNLLVAETTLREIGRVSLVEALRLTALIALKDEDELEICPNCGEKELVPSALMQLCLACGVVPKPSPCV